MKSHSEQLSRLVIPSNEILHARLAALGAAAARSRSLGEAPQARRDTPHQRDMRYWTLNTPVAERGHDGHRMAATDGLRYVDAAATRSS